VFLIEGISRACSHQIVRHRLASFSQESQRYVSLDKGEWQAVTPPALQANPEADGILAETWQRLQESYGRLRALGIRKEDARFLLPNAAETKLVRCTRGAIVDIIVDLRPESPTYLDHVAVELTADNHRALYVPERFAHGYQVLRDSTETSYQVGEFYTPGLEGGLRYDDPGLRLQWPLPVTEISEKDTKWDLLAEVEAALKKKMQA
jgi:dTDP-4-dehydrorhamnose 3,5-epimerase